ncbi:photosynthetic NDH subunit of subcomplex B 2, chloroplastic [Primulina huaijiensis]|uniref:photosynthetic NDH subunit of subcomplex B 2, chloroplastic n=1 Tax=Primulina huaijiensis TaxID=1492673 RepID=UPI003CC78D4A
MASILSFSPPITARTRASASVISNPVETLDSKFGRKGIKFFESNDIPSVELTVRNGSSLKLQIPNAHVASYMPKVYWKDDGFEEVLYTLPDSRGGIGLVIDEENSNGSLDWTVKDADSDSIDAVQVELGCTRGTLDLTYVVSLYPLSMSTAVIVLNTGSKAVTLTSAILGHFKFRSRRGSGVQGLRGCSYMTHPPISSPYEILTPSEALASEDPGFFAFGYEPEKKPGEWTVQDVPITVLKHKLSRVYAVPPAERSKPFHRSLVSKFEIIDQGRELFFRVIRMGFDDIFLSSPGSYSDKYGREYFICAGSASVLVPVIVNPGEKWRGAQIIQHDNL